MQADFWHQRWSNQQIGFHLEHVNPHLLRHYAALALSPAQRVLVPLCGKTLDIGWLLAQGVRVVGAELSEIAVQALFSALGLVPVSRQVGALMHYQAGPLEVWQGDLFALTAAQLGQVDAIYDRAALVALPPEMRGPYGLHLRQLSNTARQLLISFDYAPTLHAGPPFSVNAAELHMHYGTHYALHLLEDCLLEGGLKGQCPAHEQIWLLQPADPASQVNAA